MGDRLTEEEKKPKQTSPTPYGDIFDEFLPQYMAIGMPYDLYWDGEFGTKRAFLKAFRIRRENEERIADRNNWYIGQYVMAAISAIQLFVAGFNTKGSHIPEYPDKPFFERLDEQKKEETRKKQEEDQQMLAMAMFQAMTTQFNRNMDKKTTETGQ